MAAVLRKKMPSRAMAYGTRAPERMDELSVPSAETTIASVTQSAALRPEILATTSEATCSDCATSANGKTQCEAALNNIKITLQKRTPKIKARGMFRCGSATSDPTRFKSSQPSYAHRAAASAPKNPVSAAAPYLAGKKG